MKIVVGVASIPQARWFLRKGVDELYFGLEKIHNHRRPSLCFSSERDSDALLRLCAAAGRPLYLAVNEIYPPEEYSRISAAAARFAGKGGAGLIIRDPGLISFLREKGFDGALVLSTLGHCFNSAAMKFYARVGVSRITLPQHILPAEARAIVQNGLGLETEVFANGYCPNVDGSCRFHGIKSSAPSRELNCRRILAARGGSFSLPRFSEADRIRNMAAFYSLGVRYFKLGRWKNDLGIMKMVMSEVAAVRERIAAASGRKIR